MWEKKREKLISLMLWSQLAFLNLKRERKAER